MEVPKIQLSSAEKELMMNAEVILTKNMVLQKIRSLLNAVQEKQRGFSAIHATNNSEIFLISPKISRGEYYLGLPYIILDYPRMASANNFFFIRTMFWWGHYFSSTLHLSGTYKSAFRDKISASHSSLQHHYIGVNSDQWVHHFEEDNYKKVSSINEEDFRRRCADFEHIKIAAKWPLEKWENAVDGLYSNWKFLLNVCGINFQDGEKGL
jgi:hypothetical protein